MYFQFKTVNYHEDCTHIFVEETDNERLEILHLLEGKLYNLYFDNQEDDYYILNEEGSRCYSIDAVVQVKDVKTSRIVALNAIVAWLEAFKVEVLKIVKTSKLSFDVFTTFLIGQCTIYNKKFR